MFEQSVVFGCAGTLIGFLVGLVMWFGGYQVFPPLTNPAVTSWSTSDTLQIPLENAPEGFVGSFLDVHLSNSRAVAWKTDSGKFFIFPGREVTEAEFNAEVERTKKSAP